MNVARTNIARSAVLFAAIVGGSALVGCAAGATEPNEETGEENIGSTTQALPKQGGGGGGGGTGASCVDRWQDCYAGCGGSYPGSDGRAEAQRHACEVGCDMGYSVCKAFGGGSSSGGVIMY